MHIYVHVPFCASKCPYCSFYSDTCSSLAPEYFEALKKEINACAIVASAALPDEVNTVYFGGGTPSVVESKLICDALLEIKSKFGLTDSGEFTIEANPNSLTLEKALAYRNAGFNRISIGIQSLHEDTLKLLGRAHNREQAIDAIRLAKEAGFSNISGDLIIGVPGQRLEDIYEDAKALIEAGVKHISSYSLTIEPDTPFFDRYGEKLYDFVDEDLERSMYHGLRAFLNNHGFEAYEISNCALQGFESRHNNAYWSANEYYGFGAGSHGYLDSERYSHADDIREYIKFPDKRIVEELLSKDDKMHEFAMLSLRTSKGIDISKFEARFGKNVDDVYGDVIVSNITRGLLIRKDGYIFLTSKGLDLANQVFMDFL